MNVPLKIYTADRKMPAYSCPDCGEVLDGILGIADSPEGTIPTDGQITVCMSCRRALMIVPGGFALASAGQWEEIHPVLREEIEAHLGPVRSGAANESPRREGKGESKL